MNKYAATAVALLALAGLARAEAPVARPEPFDELHAEAVQQTARACPASAGPQDDIHSSECWYRVGWGPRFDPCRPFFRPFFYPAGPCFRPWRYECGFGYPAGCRWGW